MTERVRTIAALLGLLLASGLGLSCGRRMPRDSELRARFIRHRAAFDSLVALAAADTQLVGVFRGGASADVYVHFTQYNNRRLSEDELRSSGRSEYARLLEMAGVPGLSRRSGGTSVVFTVLASLRARKGILYSRETPEPLRESLDDLEAAGAYPEGYVRIAPEWFLFLEPKD